MQKTPYRHDILLFVHNVGRIRFKFKTGGIQILCRYSNLRYNFIFKTHTNKSKVKAKNVLFSYFIMYNVLNWSEIDIKKNFFLKINKWWKIREFEELPLLGIYSSRFKSFRGLIQILENINCKKSFHRGGEISLKENSFPRMARNALNE